MESHDDLANTLQSHSQFKSTKHADIVDCPPTGPRSTHANDHNADLHDNDAVGHDETGSAASGEHDQEASLADDQSIGSSLLLEVLDQAEHAPWHDTQHDDTEPLSEGIDPETALKLRSHLRAHGKVQFLQTYLESKVYPLQTLITAFGVRPDMPLDNVWYLRLLHLCIERELRRRQKLTEYNTIDDAARLLATCTKIMVITGAGISTSLGIPDFRSRDTGFYSKLLARGYDSPEDVFDLETFDEDPTLFYSLANEILPVKQDFSPTHAFIRLLQDKEKLLTNYTQNIDNVESFAGIDASKLIQCHGSWATATCRKCKAKMPGNEILENIKCQTVPNCTQCPLSTDAAIQSQKRRRQDNGRKPNKDFDRDDTDDEGAYDIPTAGVIKPDITFFGEQLPNHFFDRFNDQDMDQVDLVIVIGTSMKVAPVADIPNAVPRHVPQIYISREPASHINFDITLLGMCDVVVAELARRAGWRLEHEKASTSPAVVSSFDDTGHTWNVEAP